MKWIIEVLATEGDEKVWVWKAVCPTDGKPYRFDTEEEARRMRDMCYPDQTWDRVRISCHKPGCSCSQIPLELSSCSCFRD